MMSQFTEFSCSATLATYLCVPIKGDDVFRRFVATSAAILIERPNMRFLESTAQQVHVVDESATWDSVQFHRSFDWIVCDECTVLDRP